MVLNTPALAPTADKSGSLLLWLWSGYLRKHIGLLLIALLFMAIEGSMLGALSWMMKPMFDQVFLAGDSGALWWVGLSIMGIFILRALGSMVASITMSVISQSTAANLRTDLLDHLMIQDGTFHQTHPPGFLIQRIQSDVSSINMV